MRDKTSATGRADSKHWRRDATLKDLLDLLDEIDASDRAPEEKAKSRQKVIDYAQYLSEAIYEGKRQVPESDDNETIKKFNLRLYSTYYTKGKSNYEEADCPAGYYDENDNFISGPYEYESADVTGAKNPRWHPIPLKKEILPPPPILIDDDNKTNGKGGTGRTGTGGTDRTGTGGTGRTGTGGTGRTGTGGTGGTGIGGTGGTGTGGTGGTGIGGTGGTGKSISDSERIMWNILKRKMETTKDGSSEAQELSDNVRQLLNGKKKEDFVAVDSHLVSGGGKSDGAISDSERILQRSKRKSDGTTETQENYPVVTEKTLVQSEKENDDKKRYISPLWFIPLALASVGTSTLLRGSEAKPAGVIPPDKEDDSKNKTEIVDATMQFTSAEKSHLGYTVDTGQRRLAHQFGISVDEAAKIYDQFVENIQKGNIPEDMYKLAEDFHMSKMIDKDLDLNLDRAEIMATSWLVISESYPSTAKIIHKAINNPEVELSASEVVRLQKALSMAETAAQQYQANPESNRTVTVDYGLYGATKKTGWAVSFRKEKQKIDKAKYQQVVDNALQKGIDY